MIYINNKKQIKLTKYYLLSNQHSNTISWLQKNSKFQKWCFRMLKEEILSYNDKMNIAKKLHKMLQMKVEKWQTSLWITGTYDIKN